MLHTHTYTLNVVVDLESIILVSLRTWALNSVSDSLYSGL